MKSITNRIAFYDLYRGLPLKLLYNFPVLSGFYCTTQVGYEIPALLSWAAAYLLYPLNTQKVRSQVAGSNLSTINANTGSILSASYRGALPFVLLNALIGYSLRPLLSSGKLE